MVGLIITMETMMWSGTSYPFVLSILAVITSAALFGQWVGIIATVASAIASTYLFVAPARSVSLESIEELLALITFTGIGFASSIVISALYDAVQQLTETNVELSTANRQLAAADEEKDTLLQEIAHRNKNDLSMLIAMINLERRNLRDKGAVDALDSISNRIHVLSRSQDRLVRAKGEAVVHSNAFITDLCDDLRSAFAELRPIRLKVDIEDHPLRQERAVPVGLIINELVTNALKYAFPDGRSGTVRISFIREQETFCLSVEDDGKGIDVEAKPTGSGLGQRLLRSMAIQLGGYIEIRSRPGATSAGTIGVVRFPVSDEKRTQA
jgi:two-component sensor histidine kinase